MFLCTQSFSVIDKETELWFTLPRKIHDFVNMDAYVYKCVYFGSNFLKGRIEYTDSGVCADFDLLLFSDL